MITTIRVSYHLLSIYYVPVTDLSVFLTLLNVIAMLQNLSSYEIGTANLVYVRKLKHRENVCPRHQTEQDWNLALNNFLCSILQRSVTSGLPSECLNTGCCLLPGEKSAWSKACPLGCSHSISVSLCVVFK